MNIRLVGITDPALRPIIEMALQDMALHSINQPFIECFQWLDADWNHGNSTTSATSATTAPWVMQWLRDAHANVVILDPMLDAGSLLRQWSRHVGMVPILLCWTSTPQYAAEAFAAGAVHYLQQESSIEDVREAFHRIIRRLYRTVGVRPTIAMPGYDGIEVRPSNRVVCAHGYDGYTRIVLLDEPSMVLSKSLGEMESELRAAGLVRIHRSHMINPALIRKILRGKTPRVIMVNGEHVDVSPRYRDVLYEALHISVGKRAI